MKKAKNTYAVSENFQLAFSGLVITTFAIQSGWLLWTWVNSYLENPYIGGFQWWAASTVGVPLVVFAFAWMTRPKQPTQIAKIFDTLLVSMAATLVHSLATMVSQELYTYNITPGSGYDLSVRYGMVGSGLFLALYLGLLLYLR